MYDLIKNIGLGLFVNGTFALLNGDFGIMPIIIILEKVSNTNFNNPFKELKNLKGNL